MGQITKNFPQLVAHDISMKDTWWIGESEESKSELSGPSYH